MENSQSIIKSCWLIQEVPFTLSGEAEKGGASFLILRASKLLTNILDSLLRSRDLRTWSSTEAPSQGQNLLCYPLFQIMSPSPSDQLVQAAAWVQGLLCL